MKEGDTIYILTDETIRKIDYSDLQGYAGLMERIALFSETQENLTSNLTALRKAATESGNKETFDRVLKAARQGLSDADLNGLHLRYRYTEDDFANSKEPYMEVFMQPTAFLQRQTLDALAVEAARCGFRSFKATYKAFTADMRKLNARPEDSIAINPTDFPDQPVKLEAGEWNCDITGVSRTTYTGIDYACRHPIMPVERLVNIDTGEEKLKVAYLKGRRWKEVIVGKKELFDSSKIIQLAAIGVSVTSKTARTLAEYMCDMEAQNYDVIQERESVSRMGYIGDEGSFAPYVKGLVFDGEANYSHIYSAITEKGSYSDWLTVAVRCRKDSMTARIMLAAAFASPLLCKIGSLPFFVHLWGVESGTGKTVALMLAASVWGDPEIGRYIQTFNSTQVGQEKTAAFLNNIPLCIDELQLSKDSHGRSKFDVYQLAQGVGRTRGTKSGGIDITPTWSLCILTTGESPLTSDSSGAGAVNRVIDIECKASDKVIKDGFGTSAIIKQNYGFAGRKFIEALTDTVTDAARIRYEELFKQLSSGETTEKQAMAAAMLILGDELADKFIFHTGRTLTISDISEFLKSKASVSAGERGYAYMCDWVSANSNKFRHQDADGIDATPLGDIYGVIEGDIVYINKSVFVKAARDNGYDDRALLSWLKSKGLIQTRGRNYTRGKRINGVNTECVVMNLTAESPSETTNLDDYETILL